jgi:hypothetical protein
MGETTSGSSRAIEEGQHNDKKTQGESGAHVERLELRSGEHTRWHVDHAVVVELNEHEESGLNGRCERPYDEFLQRRRSLERTIDANQTATAPMKRRVIRSDSLLLDGAAFTRHVDIDKIGHECHANELQSTLVKVFDSGDQLPWPTF